MVSLRTAPFPAQALSLEARTTPHRFFNGLNFARTLLSGPLGAFALALYSWTVCVLLKKFRLSSWAATMAALIVWFAVALGASAVLFQLS